MKCQKCGTETFLPFRCQYCGAYFCAEHRLPESHDCPQIGQAWNRRAENLQVTVQWQGPKQYPALNLKSQRFRFSKKEIGHLAVAAALIVGVGLSLLSFYGATSVNSLSLVLSAIAFTFSFLAHEMAHKAVAQRHGLWAEFRLTLLGAALTAFSILPIPLKFISPGAVMVAGPADKQTMGRSASAGPATNIVLASMFSVAALASPGFGGALGIIAWFNAWIAVFNLIPFAIFDGAKVFSWNRKVWALMFVLSGAMTAVLTFVFLTGP